MKKNWRYAKCKFWFTESNSTWVHTEGMKYTCSTCFMCVLRLIAWWIALMQCMFDSWFISFRMGGGWIFFSKGWGLGAALSPKVGQEFYLLNLVIFGVNLTIQLPLKGEVTSSQEEMYLYRHSLNEAYFSILIYLFIIDVSCRSVATLMWDLFFLDMNLHYTQVFSSLVTPCASTDVFRFSSTKI